MGLLGVVFGGLKTEEEREHRQSVPCIYKDIRQKSHEVGIIKDTNVNC